MVTVERNLVWTDFYTTSGSGWRGDTNAEVLPGCLPFRSMTHNQWYKIGEWINDDPNTIVYLGGKHGYMYIYFKEAGDNFQFDGKIRICVTDPNELTKKVVWEGTGLTVSGSSSTDKTKQLKIDLRKPGCRYRSKIIIEINPYTALMSGNAQDYYIDLDDGNQVVYIPITQVSA